MKILYGIQCNGNGHITRSTEIISSLYERNHSVDIISSGRNSNLSIPFNVHKSFDGLNLYFNKRGSIDWYKTIQRVNLKNLLKDIHLDTSEYDLIISDFEPITAWSSKLQNTKSINISNQISLLSDKTPKVKDILALQFVRYFAPCDLNIGLHYQNYEEGILHPIISKKLIESKTDKDDFILIYLPAHDINYLINSFTYFKNLNWKIYSNQEVISSIPNNIEIKRLDLDSFQRDFVNCRRIITASGFSTTSESLVLKKVLWSIPIKKQFEQQSNAKALEQLGIFTEDLTNQCIQKWLDNYDVVDYQWKNPMGDIIKIIEEL